jgi:endonuclease YncB( thermonuclease family)
VIDLGFTFIIHAEVKGIKLKAGELIESIKTGENYTFKHSDAKPRELYTYKALVERVIDADTILLNIDLGFSSWARQKVRLRGIDAPELSTKEGQEARKFVEARLREVEFVVVKTFKSDKYDRYLSDVFCLKGEADPLKVLEQGTFLNQELLDLNLAVLWQ